MKSSKKKKKNLSNQKNLTKQKKLTKVTKRNALRKKKNKIHEYNMKSLYEYLIESKDAEEPQSGTFKFDFSKFADVKDSLATIADKLGDYVTEKTDTSITISCTTEDKDKVQEAIALIKDLISKNASTTKRSADESFAQYCKKQEDELKKFEDFFNQAPKPETEEEKSKDDKKEDEAE